MAGDVDLHAFVALIPCDCWAHIDGELGLSRFSAGPEALCVVRVRASRAR